MLISLLLTTARRGKPSLTTRWKNRKTIMSIQNKQVLCRKCGETDKFYYCGHCNYTTKRKYNLKGHMERKHSPILNQEDVDQDITGVKAHIPFTQPEISNVKDEVKNQELLEDSIEVLKIYKLLQRMKNK